MDHTHKHHFSPHPAPTCRLHSFIPAAAWSTIGGAKARESSYAKAYKPHGKFERHPKYGSNNQVKICTKCHLVKRDPRATIHWGIAVGSGFAFNPRWAVFDPDDPNIVYIPENSSQWPRTQHEIKEWEMLMKKRSQRIDKFRNSSYDYFEKMRDEMF